MFYLSALESSSRRQPLLKAKLCSIIAIPSQRVQKPETRREEPPSDSGLDMRSFVMPVWLGPVLDLFGHKTGECAKFPKLRLRVHSRMDARVDKQIVYLCEAR